MPIKIPIPSKRARNSGVGLYVGPSHVAAVAVSRKRVLAAKSVDLEPGIVLEDRIGNPEALTDVIREVTSGSEFGRQVYLGLGAQHGIVRVLEMPLIEDEQERDTAVRYHAAEAIAMPLDDAPLDHAFIGQEVTPGVGARMRILVAAARRGRVYDLHDCVRAAGLRPQGVELEPFALVRAVAKPAAEAEPVRVVLPPGRARHARARDGPRLPPHACRSEHGQRACRTASNAARLLRGPAGQPACLRGRPLRGSGDGDRAARDARPSGRPRVAHREASRWSRG